MSDTDEQLEKLEKLSHIYKILLYWESRRKFAEKEYHYKFRFSRIAFRKGNNVMGRTWYYESEKLHSYMQHCGNMILGCKIVWISVKKASGLQGLTGFLKNH